VRRGRGEAPDIEARLLALLVGSEPERMRTVRAAVQEELSVLGEHVETPTSSSVSSTGSRAVGRSSEMSLVDDSQPEPPGGPLRAPPDPPDREIWRSHR
jgi:hypothetical protein